MRPAIRTSLREWLLTVARLTGKELQSLFGDLPLMVLIAFSFTVAIYVTAKGIKADVDNATVAIIDSDQSTLSRRIRDAIQQPYFQPPVEIERKQVEPAMNRGDFIFVVEIPPRFEADILASRSPSVQILVDATAMTQAGLGAVDLSQIFTTEVSRHLKAGSIEDYLPAKPVVRTLFNPNSQSYWFSSVMQIITNITALTIILAGAAVIREREHGTIEHLLVMPVQPNQIALAKILANSGVMLFAVMLSIWFVVHIVLGVPLPSPVAGTLLLFALGTTLYLFAAAALGIWLATLTSSMPQFSLLSAPVYVVMYLLSGASTPIESMPVLMRHITQFSPTTQFVKLTQAVIYRGADFSIVWPQLLAELVFGVIFLLLALTRFRTMLTKQN